MKFEICDIWDKYDEGYNICITTNGYVKENGFAVCGKGVALQAVKRIPGFARLLGKSIYKGGNVVIRICDKIVSFPVKPKEGICNTKRSNVVAHQALNFYPGQTVPGWAMKASIELIEQSLHALHLYAGMGFFSEIYLPRPGCGAGDLRWWQVKPILERYGDWLIVCDLKG